MGFFRQKSWSEFSFPPPGDLPDPGIEPESLVSPALVGRFFTTWANKGISPKNRSGTSYPWHTPKKRDLKFCSIQWQTDQRTHTLKYIPTSRPKVYIIGCIPTTEQKPHTLDIHTQIDQITHILEYTPTTESEVSHPGKQHPNRSERLHDLRHTLKELRYLPPWYIYLWTERDLVYCNIQPQSCQGSHTFGTYIQQQHRKLTTPLNSLGGWNPRTQIPPALKNSHINIWTQTLKHHRNFISRNSVAQTVLTPSTLDADSSHLGDISFWALKIPRVQRTNKTCMHPPKSSWLWNLRHKLLKASMSSHPEHRLPEGSESSNPELQYKEF